MPRHQYTYGLNAADLLNQLEQEVSNLIDKSETCQALLDLRDKLQTTRNHLLDYLVEQIEIERRGQSLEEEGYERSFEYPDNLKEAVEELNSLLLQDIKTSRTSTVDTLSTNPTASVATKMPPERINYFQTKSTNDTMLFRLVVMLQLCLVRIEYVRRTKTKSTARKSLWALGEIFTVAGLLSYSLPRLSYASRHSGKHRIALLVAGTGALSMTSHWIRGSVSTWWACRKINNSSNALDFWNEQWGNQMVGAPRLCRQTVSNQTKIPENGSHEVLCETPPSPKRLNRYQSALDLSEGEFRFLMLKRFMDVFYASVDTAANFTSRGESGQAHDWQLHLATAAAATFYSLTGASTKAVQVTSSSKSARQLLEKAWGMVSMPAIKSLSLHASKLAKGAAVADRIQIADVTCFILSREPVPELALCLKQQHRRARGKPMIHRLSTIDERKEHEHELSSTNLQQNFARGEYCQRDVILHLTGGGFFAHIIASDLPYLLDWSHATGAVVICPEYSLLPEKRFPFALQDVENVYRSLRDPDIVYTLGFEVNRIILTGESAGGNLAAALCIKLQMFSKAPMESENSENLSDISDTEEADLESIHEDVKDHCLPNALMLSSPVLDLSSGPRLSNSSAQMDPVLPSGLVSAISNAYVPEGIRKNMSLISPLHAPDTMLENFPSTLIFASSNDSLLDDSIVFNERLRNLGVSSDLRAVDNLPHAYLGLGTAGFPEAQHAQDEIQKWLIQQLERRQQ